MPARPPGVAGAVGLVLLMAGCGSSDVRKPVTGKPKPRASVSATATPSRVRSTLESDSGSDPSSTTRKASSKADRCAPGYFDGEVDPQVGSVAGVTIGMKQATAMRLLGEPCERRTYPRALELDWDGVLISLRSEVVQGMSFSGSSIRLQDGPRLGDKHSLAAWLEDFPGLIEAESTRFGRLRLQAWEGHVCLSGYSVPIHIASGARLDQQKLERLTKGAKTSEEGLRAAEAALTPGDLDQVNGIDFNGVYSGSRGGADVLPSRCRQGERGN
jgi:hypothetical protein